MRSLCAILFCFVAIAAHAASLDWNPTGEAGVAGYTVYVGPGSRAYDRSFDVGNTTSWPLDWRVKRGETNFFAVTAYDANHVESDWSDEVCWVRRSSTLRIQLELADDPIEILASTNLVDWFVIGTITPQRDQPMMFFSARKPARTRSTAFGSKLGKL